MITAKYKNLEAEPIPALKGCPKCGVKVSGNNTNYCQNCETKRKKEREPEELRDPLTAAGWNLVIFGAGFAYLGQWGKAFASILCFLLVTILVGTILGSAANIISILIMYLLIMIACAKEAERINEGQ